VCRIETQIFRTRAGFGLVEGLIAIAIVAIGMFFAIPEFHRTYQIVNNFERKGKCERAFLGATSAIELTPPEYRTANVERGFFRATPRAAPNVVNRFNDLAFQIPADPVIQARFARHGVDRLYQTLPGGAITDGNLDFFGVRLYTPLLLAGPMGYLADLYNTGYCAAFLPVPDFIRNLVQDPNINMSMRVRRQNLLTKAIEAACPPFFPRARNQFGRDTIYEPYTEVNYPIASYDPGGPGGNVMVSADFGFVVELHADVLGPTGAVDSTCDVERPYSLPMDFQNVMDFLHDLRVAKWRGYALGPDPYLDMTRDPANPVRGLVLNKKAAFDAATINLQTIYSNYYTQAVTGYQLKDRPECSQRGNEVTRFTLALELRNLRKEPGVIAMCLDTSYNWLWRPAPNNVAWNWCQKTAGPPTPDATVRIIADAQSVPRSQGWVPCEDLWVCRERPVATRVTQPAAGTIRYEYDYAVTNDRNDGGASSRLWGCEIKYGVALVDPAGNMSYVPNEPLTQDAQVSAFTLNQAAPSAMREVNPKIYPRPAPCYTCNCKPCKGKSLFGGFFSWLILLVLIVATGGLALFAFPIIATVVGLGALNCLAGNMGCKKSSNYEPPNFDAAGYLSCRDQNQGCGCGHRCTKNKAPGPLWVDRLEGAINDDDTLLSSQCTADPVGAPHTVVTATGNFKVLRAYKKPIPGGYEYLPNPVEPGDEVLWEEFNSATGQYCYAIHVCVGGAAGTPGTFQVQSTTFDDELGNAHNGTLAGCYNVKTAHKIMWGDSSAAAPPQNKPNLGPPVCLETNYWPGRHAQNPSGEPLRGWGWAEYECAEDTGVEASPPAPPLGTPANMRYVGRALGGCAQTYVLPPAIRPAAPLAIHGMCGMDPCFTCWSECRPPLNSPSNPLNGMEMRYYENYNAGAHSGLPWCARPNDGAGVPPPKVFDTHIP